MAEKCQPADDCESRKTGPALEQMMAEVFCAQVVQIKTLRGTKNSTVEYYCIKFQNRLNSQSSWGALILFRQALIAKYKNISL